jgi:aminoglycoside phosphotransferase (APT) family kinase protein
VETLPKNKKHPLTAPPSTPSLDPAIRDFLRDSKLVHGDAFKAEPLTGGVASDIWRITDGDTDFVVKRALPRLRVAQVWEAPVSRNASEVEWMLEAGRIVPDAVPRVLAHDAARGAFAMSFLDPASHPVWKAELMTGRIDVDFAGAVGALIATIHAGTAGRADVATRFANDATFHALRLEPYLEATARRHEDLAERLFALSRGVLAKKTALVHGDVSPKNTLAGPRGPVLLDAECAWYGDPCFDLAFCLNHLLLKCVWAPVDRARYVASFGALVGRYLERVDWEPAAGLEARTAALLPALLLARIDGKSPVEYITDEGDKALVRDFARRHVASPPPGLVDLAHAWLEELPAHE